MSSVTRVLGQVKWFNNKEGYGFITVSEGEQAGNDIFVHYTFINVTNSQYRYLVQGEYIEFVIDISPNGSHKYHATQVSGVRGGKLMCETRRTFRQDDNGSQPFRKYVPSTDDNNDGNFQQVINRKKTNNKGGRGGGRNDNKPITKPDSIEPI